MKLTVKQKRFADYFIETGNATEAYKKAGYSAKDDNIAGVEGHKLLKNPKIDSYIKELISEKDHERIASQDEVLEFLTKVLRGEETEKIPISGKDWFEMIDNNPSIKDRTKAAELLGKRYTLWTEKVEQTTETKLVIKRVRTNGNDS
ncbi:terminase small subunit [Bacillus sp. FJAT-49736]|uniref:terminase small subunit n=1 Tax=Bacillus sp. FJAT-49736 TaxID=2833582 RepID=UPI001BCA02CC|nr:terminase small subunit [Bacillus sp. FJAT-49736]MBS4173479.1 terminase small subunit [Bacillus sp. FJAT-49736]